MGIELWTTGIAHANVAPRAAARAEAAGWDGMAVVDSQNLSGDPFVALALAAEGDVEPAARHRRHQPGDPPSGGARRAAIASVHVASPAAGRCSASAAATPRSPTSASRPRRVDDLERLRAHLRAATCAARPSTFADLRPYERADARPVDVLGLADTPGARAGCTGCRATSTPVPVEVVATGPKVLDARRRATPTASCSPSGPTPSGSRWAIDQRPRRPERRSSPRSSTSCTHPDVEMARRLAPAGMSRSPASRRWTARCARPIDAESEAGAARRSTTPTTCTTTPAPARRRPAS